MLRFFSRPTLVRSQVTLGTCAWYGGLGSDEVLHSCLYSSVLTSVPPLSLPVKCRHPWSRFWAYRGRDAFERTDVPGFNLPPSQTTTVLQLYICSCSINNWLVLHRKEFNWCAADLQPNVFESEREFENAGGKLVDLVMVDGFGLGDARFRPHKD